MFSPHLGRRLVAAVLLVLPLSACGHAGHDPQVATLPSSGTSPRASSQAGEATTSDAGRPLFRVDDTDERRQALWTAYSACLLRHGAQPAPAADPGTMSKRRLAGILVVTPAPKRAVAACADDEPYGPPELQASTNPDFHRQSLSYVACLRHGGIEVVLLNDHDLDWTFAEDQGPMPGNAEALYRQCMVSSFGSDR